MKSDLIKAKARVKKRYIKDKGIVSVKILARVGKVEQKQVRAWIKDENWKDLVVEEPGDVVTLSDKTKNAIHKAEDDFNLTEEERLFCYHYLKTHNATTAAARAGYPSTRCYQRGYDMLNHNEEVKAFLRYIRGLRDEELMIDAIDILNQYMRIAFMDITDFVAFKNGTVAAKSSIEVDGQLISEISEGPNGIKIKFHNKLDALKRLEEYIDMPKNWKKGIEEKKLELMERRLELQRDFNDKVEKLSPLDGLTKEELFAILAQTEDLEDEE